MEVVAARSTRANSCQYFLRILLFQRLSTAHILTNSTTSFENPPLHHNRWIPTSESYIFQQTPKVADLITGTLKQRLETDLRRAWRIMFKETIRVIMLWVSFQKGRIKGVVRLHDIVMIWVWNAQSVWSPSVVLTGGWDLIGAGVPARRFVVECFIRCSWLRSACLE